MFGLKQEHIELINACFAQYPAITEVTIYGSRAKGNYRPGSDIDLTIISERLSQTELIHLENKLDDLLLPYKIDLSLKTEISNKDLLQQIDNTGKVFYS
jgi:predicted nucleotidyltransferase